MDPELPAEFASDPCAAAIIRAVVSGTTTPLEGAAQLAEFWVPAEAIGAPVLGERDSVHWLNRHVDALWARDMAGARRLAELNWLLANDIGHAELLVVCASTFAQVLVIDPEATLRRLELAEFAAPQIVAWNGPGVVSATMLAHLADARFNEARQGADLGLRAADAAEQALAMGAADGWIWAPRLHMIAGTVPDSVADSEEPLRRSIEHLTTAAAIYRTSDPDGYQSALHNLGSSYLRLGRLTGDTAVVRQAIDTYETALPLRPDGLMLSRTTSQLARARHLLDTLEGRQSEAPMAVLPDKIGAGDSAMELSLDGGPLARAHRRRAAAHYVTAVSATAPGDTGSPRAEALQRLALLFEYAEGEDAYDDAFWAGLCFARSALRLGSHRWTPSLTAKVTLQAGALLLKIGFPQHMEYLMPANQMLRECLETLRAGEDPLVKPAVGTQQAVLALLAGYAGDEEDVAREIRLSLSANARADIAADEGGRLRRIAAVAEPELIDLLVESEQRVLREDGRQAWYASQGFTIDRDHERDELLRAARLRNALGDHRAAAKLLERAQKLDGTVTLAAERFDPGAAAALLAPDDPIRQADIRAKLSDEMGAAAA